MTGSARSLNEDAVRIDPRRGCFVLADGMGGYAAGQLASRVIADLVSRRLAESHHRFGGRELVCQVVSAAVEEAHMALKELANDAAPGREIGSTLIAAVVHGDLLTVAHVGDSRAYVARDGRLEQVTVDHTLASEMVRAGILSRSEEPAHPYRSVLSRNLGSGNGNHEPDLITVALRPGDRILLATDGLTSTVSVPNLERILCRQPEPQRAAAALVEAALRLKARDDLSCVVANVLAGESDAQA